MTSAEPHAAACTVSACDKSQGVCKPEAKKDGAPCDDGVACTIGDGCKAGKCAYDKSTCQCFADPDCAKLDDGDLCNGVFVCDKANKSCVFDPSSVVVCKSVGDTACVKNTCAKTTGKCAPTAVKDGTACDDGNACSKASGCVGGKCQGKTGADCNDGNACTSDVCDKGAGCKNTPHTGACTDTDPCTTNEQCDAGVCKTKATACDDKDPCTTDFCDAAKGCATKPATGAVCDDANVCTSKSFCKAGKCAGTADKVCDDKNPCTNDFCDPAKGCTHPHNTAKCDDGDVCTGGDTCKAGECTGVTGVGKKWLKLLYVGKYAGHFDALGIMAATGGKYLVVGSYDRHWSTTDASWAWVVDSKLNTTGNLAFSTNVDHIRAVGRSKNTAWAVGGIKVLGKMRGAVNRHSPTNGAFLGMTVLSHAGRLSAVAPSPTCACTVVAGPEASSKDIVVARITDAGKISWEKKIFTGIALDVGGLMVRNNQFTYAVDVKVAYRVWRKKSDWSAVGHTDITWPGALHGFGLHVPDTDRFILPGSYVKGTRRPAFAEAKFDGGKPTGHIDGTAGVRNAHFQGAGHAKPGASSDAFLFVGWEEQKNGDTASRRMFVQARPTNLGAVSYSKTLPWDRPSKLVGAIRAGTSNNWLVVGSDSGSSRRYGVLARISMGSGAAVCQ